MIHSAVLGMALLLATQATDKVFVGYLYGPARDINFRLYTHLCHAFVVADGDGTIRRGRNVPSKDLTAEAHKNGVQVLLSLGGWGWDKQFAEIVSKPESEDRYVAAVLAMVKEHDYDGIDLDWEYPDTDAEIIGFERLSRRFRAGLDDIGKEKERHLALTMAAAANPGTLSGLKTKFLVETFDWINVMTYDFTGAWTGFAGHHSPLYASSKQKGKRSVTATMEFLLNERKLPADRLALGIPLYGRGFPVAEPYASTQRVAKRRLPQGNYRNLARLQREGWTRTWDDETKNPWLRAPDGTAVIGYDDAESVELKAAWAREQGLRGVFFWEISADRVDGSNPLQEAAHKALFDAPKSKP